MGSQTEELFERSPLGFLLEKDSNILSEFEKKNYNEIRDVVKKTEMQKKEPVRLVLAGEVKAGKSTLLNALAGCEVAYTDILEATCAVSEIHYGTQEHVNIFYQDGMVEDMHTVSEYCTWMRQNCRDMAYFNKIQHIEVMARTERLKELILADTPGLLSLREENGDKTQEFLANADVFVWVLNGTKIGQEDVYEELEALERFGKPILCVVNKKDLLSSSRERIISYVKDDLGDLVQKVFFVSAKEGNESIRTGNSILWENSGIEELYEYLTTQIERKQKSFKSVVELQTQLRQIEKELYLHKAVKERMQKQYRQFTMDIQEITKKKKSIDEEIKKNLQTWIKTRFFKKEQGKLFMASNEEQLQILLDEYCSNEYIDGVLQEKYKQLCNEISILWNAVNDTYFHTDFERKTVFIDSMKSSENEKMEMQVGMTGAGTGLAVAGYLAWFGPEAASITLAGAVSSIAPPIVLLTGVGYLICKNYQDNKKQKWKTQLLGYVKEVYEDMISYIMKETYPRMAVSLENFSGNYYLQIVNKIRSAEELIGFRIEELNTIAAKISDYEILLESAIKDCQIQLQAVEEEPEDVFDESRFA